MRSDPCAKPAPPGRPAPARSAQSSTPGRTGSIGESVRPSCAGLFNNRTPELFQVNAARDLGEGLLVQVLRVEEVEEVLLEEDVESAVLGQLVENALQTGEVRLVLLH